ncbi:acyl-CoA dehydrogenase family protein [Glaciimonas immobilis]|uniref:Acyl-CoA dehydrogenase n=1 Tax=Glaciimonas immobilis TaxID=728004 RepID=A0A840RYX8_9BURK|nr:acyl-CoA dehydrogenase family protein [Glaciimonas immobilis]KAF3996146.1 acyl-CoA dehydrogenase [Glaciimonas immobilis]MBB5201701.1 acyl-CoA dehydrogenase [Glaciimonas immobilis]
MRQLFESTVQRIFGDIVTPASLLARKAGEWPTQLWAAIEESGFSVAPAPESLGGSDASWNDLYVVVRAAGRYTVPAPLPEALLANWLLGRSGLDAISGPLSFAAANTLVFADGKVTGQLQEVPWGRHVAQVVAVVAGTGDLPSQIVVLNVKDATLANLRLNMADEPRDDLRFNAAQPLAFAALPSDLPADILLLGGAMLRSAQIAGALQAALEMTSRYATERSQFGRPIANFQAIQHRLAILAEHTANAMVASEAAFAESGDQLALLPLMAAKVCASEAASIAADTVHAIHGAIGITHEHALHLVTQRLWSWRSEFGSQTFWAQRIGREVCANGAHRFWPAITSAKLEAENNPVQKTTPSGELS